MILHHRELTYSFTLPAVERPRAVYDRLNQMLAATLAHLGAPVTIATNGATTTTGPCFAGPSPGELIYDGRKIAGSAQWREHGVVLQHGSILIDNDQEGVEPATLRAALGRAPTAAELADAFGAIVDTVTLALEPMVRDEARHLSQHYSSDAWTWRRKKLDEG